MPSVTFIAGHSEVRLCTSKLSRLCLREQMKFEISSFFTASVWVIFRRDSCRKNNMKAERQTVCTLI